MNNACQYSKPNIMFQLVSTLIPQPTPSFHPPSFLHLNLTNPSSFLPLGLLDPYSYLPLDLLNPSPSFH